jgi:voltage-gated potassium channel
MRRALLFSLTLIFVVIIFGTIGFFLTEPTVHHDLGLSLWLTMVTMTTVGYGDYYPTVPLARFVGVVVMVAGVGAVIYTFTTLFQLVVTANLRSELGLPVRRTRMKDHYIVCGYGNVGREVMSHLKCRGENFVVIERDRLKVESLVEKGVPVIQGDAEDEDTLRRANVLEAKGLITVLRDSQNLVVIIAAKGLNPDLYVVSEVEEDKNITKLQRVGAESIINCHEMGARIMVDQVRHAYVDPVCEVELTPATKKLEYKYKDLMLGFCCQACLDAFKAHPDRFMAHRRGEDINCGLNKGT